METTIAIAAIVIIGVLSLAAALVFAPRKIADDVMQEIYGDTPHIGN
jgi:hypothetical protein